VAAYLSHCRLGGIEIGTDEITPLLGSELSRKPGRIHQIAEHHREIAAFSNRFGSW
jgi:hypothetical protein